MTILIIAIVVLLVAFPMLQKVNSKGIQSINSDGLKKLLDQGKIQLIDVRTPQEYASHHAKGFKNIPLQVLATQINSLDKSLPIVVMCASGARSLQGSQLLAKNGFETVYNFSGGINSYKK